MAAHLFLGETAKDIVSQMGLDQHEQKQEVLSYLSNMETGIFIWTRFCLSCVQRGCSPSPAEIDQMTVSCMTEATKLVYVFLVNRPYTVCFEREVFFSKSWP